MSPITRHEAEQYANQWNERQLDTATYTRSVLASGIPLTGLDELAETMRTQVDEMVYRLPEALRRFNSLLDESFSPNMTLSLSSSEKISEGAWNVSIQLQQEGRQDKTADFRLQWSGKIAGSYHLFALSSGGEAAIIPTVVEEADLPRELGIFSCGQQYSGTPLSRLSRK